MKRSLIYILIVVVFAGWIGTLIARDPGYVLISYDGATLETGLWVMLAILAIAGAVLYYLVRIVRAFRGSGALVRGWRANRKRERLDALTAKGMALLEMGDYERAERFLVNGPQQGQRAALNFISAARAADGRGDVGRRDSLLDSAVRADPSIKQAAAMAKAEMSAQRHQWRQCLDSLEGCENNRVVLKLKKKALFELKDWHALMELMPRLRKVEDDPTEAFEFEKEVALARLSEDMTDDGRKIVYKKLLDDLKKDPDIILTLVRRVTDEKYAESLLRGALKSNWHSELVIAYGELGPETVARRIKAAQGWLKRRPEDYAVHYCLGELHRLNGDQWKARDSFQKSMELKPTPDASERLAQLYSLDGDHAKSNEYFRQALKLSE